MHVCARARTQVSDGVRTTSAMLPRRMGWNRCAHPKRAEMAIWRGWEVMNSPSTANISSPACSRMLRAAGLAGSTLSTTMRPSDRAASFNPTPQITVLCCPTPGRERWDDGPSYNALKDVADDGASGFHQSTSSVTGVYALPSELPGKGSASSCDAGSGSLCVCPIARPLLLNKPLYTGFGFSSALRRWATARRWHNGAGVFCQHQVCDCVSVSTPHASVSTSHAISRPTVLR